MGQSCDSWVICNRFLSQFRHSLFLGLPVTNPNLPEDLRSIDNKKRLREVFMGTGYKPSRVRYLLNQ